MLPRPDHRSPIRTRRSAPGRAQGFTLAEVAVTIVIVGIGLLLVMQGLNAAKITAAHTRNLKLARELGGQTLGQVASGLMAEDIEAGGLIQGNYAEQGYPDFTYEVALGDEPFLEEDEEFDTGTHDSWAKDEDEEEEDDEAEQPYEKVRVRVTFTQIQELQNDLVLERWFPWDQVHPEDTGETAGTTTP